LFRKPLGGKVGVNYLSVSLPGELADWGIAYVNDLDKDLPTLAKMLEAQGFKESQINRWLAQIRQLYNESGVTQLADGSYKKDTDSSGFDGENYSANVKTNFDLPDYSTGETKTGVLDLDEVMFSQRVEMAKERLRELAENNYSEILLYPIKEAKKYGAVLQTTFGRRGFFRKVSPLIQIMMVAQSALDCLAKNYEFLKLYQQHQPVSKIILETVISLTEGLQLSDGNLKTIIKRIENNLKESRFFSIEINLNQGNTFPNIMSRLIKTQLAQPFKGDAIKEMKTLAALYLAATDELTQLNITELKVISRAKELNYKVSVAAKYNVTLPRMRFYSPDFIKKITEASKEITEETKKKLMDWILHNHRISDDIKVQLMSEISQNGMDDIFLMAEQFKLFIEQASQVFSRTAEDAEKTRSRLCVQENICGAAEDAYWEEMADYINTTKDKVIDGVAFGITVALAAIVAAWFGKQLMPNHQPKAKRKLIMRHGIENMPNRGSNSEDSEDSGDSDDDSD